MADKPTFGSQKERDDYTVGYVLSLINKTEQETMPDRDRWRENEQLFAGKMEWGQDEEGAQWQSRVFLHEYSTIIREAAVQLQQMIFERPEFINLIAGDASNKELARIREKLIKHYINDMRFPHKFMEYCLVGGIYGFATWKETVSLKPYWAPDIIIEQVRKQQEKELGRATAEGPARKLALASSPDEIEQGLEDAFAKIFGLDVGLPRRTVGAKKKLELCMNLKLCNPHLLYFDPTAEDMNDSLFVAEKSFPKFVELIPFFENGSFDKRKRQYLKKQGPTNSTGVLSDRLSLNSRQKDLYTKVDEPLNEVELIEYFGPLVKNGEVYEEAAHVVIANGKHLLKYGVNPYWDRKPPYFTAVFNKRPFKGMGSGIADNAVAQQKLINELFSLFVDAVKRDVYAPMAINVDKLADPTQISKGIAPGSIVHVYGDGKASDVISDFPSASDAAPQLFQVTEALKLSAQKGSSVNTMSSNPASRARISAQEISSNDQRRLQTLNSLGMEIDLNCIEALVKKTDALLLQFGFTNDNLDAMAKKGVLLSAEVEMVKQMPEADRFLEAIKDYKIEIRGFRAVMERDKQLRSSAELVQQINQMPPFVQQSLQWPNILQDLVEHYGFDPNRWIRMNSPQDKAREENAFLLIEQMVSIAENDDDIAQLPVHYEAALQGGLNQALQAHIMGHIQRAQSRGELVPPPPPELAEQLGFASTEAPMGQQGPIGPQTMQ